MTVGRIASVKQWTVPQIADDLGVTGAQVRSWVKDGLLPARRTGLAKAGNLERHPYRIDDADYQWFKTILHTAAHPDAR